MCVYLGTFTCKKKRNEWCCLDTETCISSAEVNRSGRIGNHDNQSDKNVESYVEVGGFYSVILLQNSSQKLKFKSIRETIISIQK